MSPTSPRIVVTGVTGFLGSHVLAALRDRGLDPVAAVRDPSRLTATHRGPVVVGDLTDSAYRQRIVEGADVVIHAGTWSSFWGHRRHERELFLEPTLDLLEQAARSGVGRVLVASTIAMSEPSRNGLPVAEDAEPVARHFWPHHAAMVTVDRRQRDLAVEAPATQQIALRLGHFVGAGNSMGLASALVPRLRTRQVPWVDHGRAHMPLVSGRDMGEAFALAALAPSARLAPYEAIAVVGPEQPTAREVIGHIADTAGVPAPAYSVPLRAAYGFGALMEALHPVLPGRAPFLTRSLVFVGEDWLTDARKASMLLGYEPQDDWREAIAAQLAERAKGGYAWPDLAQRVGV